VTPETFTCAHCSNSRGLAISRREKSILVWCSVCAKETLVPVEPVKAKSKPNGAIQPEEEGFVDTSGIWQRKVD